MKIKQTDYSAMVNANALALSSKQAGSTNASMKYNLGNVDKVQSIYNLQQSSIKHQQKALTNASYGNMINDFMTGAQGFAQAKQTHDKAKATEEQASATISLNQGIASYNQELNRLQSEGKLFDENMNPTQEANALNQKYLQMFDGLGYSKATTDALKNSFASNAGSAYLNQANAYINSEINAIGEARQTIISDFITKATSNGGNTPKNESELRATVSQWTDLPPQTREVLVAQTMRNVDVGAVDYEARSKTDTLGYNDAHNFLKEQLDAGRITLDEYDQYDAACYTRHKNNLARTNQIVTDTFNETIQNEGTVPAARAAAELIIDNAPSEDQAELLDTLNSLQLNMFYADNPWAGNLGNMTSAELLEHAKELEEDKEGYFTGIEDIQKTLGDTLRSQASAVYSAQQSSEFDNFKRTCEIYDNLFEGGAISGSGYVTYIMNEIDSKDNDGNYRYASIRGTSDVMGYVQGKINTAIDKTLPSWYKNDYKELVNQIAKSASDLAIEGYGVNEFEADLYGKIMDFLYDYGKSPASDAQIERFLNSMEKETLGQILTKLGSSGDIISSGGIFSDTWEMGDYFNLIDSISGGELYYVDREGIYYNQDTNMWEGGESNKGQVRSIGKTASAAWDKATAEGARALEQIYGKKYITGTTYLDDANIIPAYSTSEGSKISIVPAKDNQGNVIGAEVQKVLKTGTDEKGNGIYSNVTVRTISMDGISIPTEEGLKYGEPKATINLATGKPVSQGGTSSDDYTPTEQEAQVISKAVENSESLQDFAAQVDYELDPKNGKPKLTDSQKLEAYFKPIYEALDSDPSRPFEIYQKMVDDGLYTEGDIQDFIRIGYDDWASKHNASAEDVGTGDPAKTGNKDVETKLRNEMRTRFFTDDALIDLVMNSVVDVYEQKVKEGASVKEAVIYAAKIGNEAARRL